MGFARQMRRKRAREARLIAATEVQTYTLVPALDHDPFDQLAIDRMIDEGGPAAA